MKAKDLIIGAKYLYQDDGEKCMVQVLEIDNEKKVVKFKDWEYFEWEEPFDDIPETIIKRLECNEK